MIVLTVANLKGGSGKTTTAAYVAHALHEQGKRVLVVDADPQGSALRWSQTAEWPLAVVALPTPRLSRQLPEITGDRFDAVVIDTPPLEHDRGIVLSAMRAASHLLIPLAPSPIEYDRLPATLAVLDELAGPPAAAVLLTRTVAHAAATEVYREVITADGWRVLRAGVRNLQRYCQAYGRPIERALATAYGDAVTELLTPQGATP